MNIAALGLIPPMCKETVLLRSGSGVTAYSTGGGVRFARWVKGEINEPCVVSSEHLRKLAPGFKDGYLVARDATLALKTDTSQASLRYLAKADPKGAADAARAWMDAIKLGKGVVSGPALRAEVQLAELATIEQPGRPILKGVQLVCDGLNMTVRALNGITLYTSSLQCGPGVFSLTLPAKELSAVLNLITDDVRPIGLTATERCLRLEGDACAGEVTAYEQDLPGIKNMPEVELDAPVFHVERAQLAKLAKAQAAYKTAPYLTVRPGLIETKAVEAGQYRETLDYEGPVRKFRISDLLPCAGLPIRVGEQLAVCDLSPTRRLYILPAVEVTSA